MFKRLCIQKKILKQHLYLIFFQKFLLFLFLLQCKTCIEFRGEGNLTKIKTITLKKKTVKSHIQITNQNEKRNCERCVFELCNV